MAITRRKPVKQLSNAAPLVAAAMSAAPEVVNVTVGEPINAEPPSRFAFALGQHATIAASHESGDIIARSEYLYGEPQYMLRYKANDGRAVEAWWAESALTA